MPWRAGPISLARCSRVQPDPRTVPTPQGVAVIHVRDVAIERGPTGRRGHDWRGSGRAECQKGDAHGGDERSNGDEAVDSDQDVTDEDNET